MKTQLILFMILGTFISCTTYGPLYKEKPEKIALSIPLNSFEIEIIDKRTNTSDRLIHLQLMTFGGEYDSVSPIVPKELKQVLTETIENLKIEGNRNLKFQVLVYKGFQKFYSTGNAEVEYVKVEIGVNVFDLDSGIKIDNTTIESWGEKHSWDASLKKISKMYVNAFLQAFKKGLSKMNLE